MARHGRNPHLTPGQCQKGDHLVGHVAVDRPGAPVRPIEGVDGGFGDLLGGPPPLAEVVGTE